MQAIILAAGVGSRLRPITNELPKCLVQVNGKSIIEYQIDAYLDAEIEEIIVLTGYMQEKLVKFLKSKYQNVKITFINNDYYRTTNNMYSLYLEKDLIKGEFIMSNADVVFSKDMVKLLLKNKEDSIIAVEKDMYNEESMKIVVSKNKVKSISKQIEKSKAYGTSIDLYKFNKEATELMFTEISYIINKDKNLNSWTEVALDSILYKTIFKPMNIGERFWYEIDNHEDLKSADKIVKEYLERNDK